MYIARFYKEKVQPLKEHLENVCKFCVDFSINLNLKNTLILCGYLHDMGKYSEEFQKYIRDEKAKNDSKIISSGKKVDHAVYGAKYIYGLTHCNQYEKITKDIIAEVISYHHGGLPDNVNEYKIPIIERMEKVDPEIYTQITNCFMEDNPNFTSGFIQETFIKAAEEIKEILTKIKKNKSKFEIGLLIKNIYSILVDADRWDSYLFTVDYEYTENPDTLNLWKKYNDNLQRQLDIFKQKEVYTDLEKNVKSAREIVSEKCRDFAVNPTGIYNLTVPTGGGKTFASLNFALNHAIKHNKQRIIYIIPYTSIIEQNAREVRNILDCNEYLLEYHSNIMNSIQKEDNINCKGVDDNKNEDYQIVSERWTSPIIFTTTVQFLNCIFASGNDNIRRMHNLENSVIIFDEIQTLPIKCINIFYNTIDYLKNVCNTTIVLCTATQPNMPSINKKLNLTVDGEIISDRLEIFNALKRMNVVDKTEYSMSFEDVSDFVSDIKSSVKSVLVVVNTIASAENIWRDIKEKTNCEIYLLTTRMCPKHRKILIEEIKQKLKENVDVICVSTQLIEAGVDISFEAVVRSLSGLDSIAQSTGRGNRHGEKSISNSYIIKINEENLGNLEEIKIGQRHTLNLLYEYNKNPNDYNNSLLSEKSIYKYYEMYFNDGDIAKNMYYPINNGESVFGLLENRKERISHFNGKYQLCFCYQFETARKNFRVIDHNTKTVIVTYSESKKLIGELLSDSIKDKYKILKQLQVYSVNLYPNMIKYFEEQNGFIYMEEYGIYILDEAYYSDEIGVTTEKKPKVEENIF